MVDIMYYGFTILVFLLVLVGQMLIQFASWRMYRRSLFNLTKYFEKKKLRALKFSKEEKNEEYKNTYLALASAWEIAEEKAEKELKKCK